MERFQKQPTKANLAQLVEHHLAKVDVEGSSPLVRSISYGGVAQLVEQVTLNHWVHGSSPCTPTIKEKSADGSIFLFLSPASHFSFMVYDIPCGFQGPLRGASYARAVQAIACLHLPRAALRLPPAVNCRPYSLRSASEGAFAGLLPRPALAAK